MNGFQKLVTRLVFPKDGAPLTSDATFVIPVAVGDIVVVDKGQEIVEIDKCLSVRYKLKGISRMDDVVSSGHMTTVNKGAIAVHPVTTASGFEMCVKSSFNKVRVLRFASTPRFAYSDKNGKFTSVGTDTYLTRAQRDTVYDEIEEQMKWYTTVENNIKNNQDLDGMPEFLHGTPYQAIGEDIFGSSHVSRDMFARIPSHCIRYRWGYHHADTEMLVKHGFLKEDQYPDFVVFSKILGAKCMYHCMISPAGVIDLELLYDESKHNELDAILDKMEPGLTHEKFAARSVNNLTYSVDGKVQLGLLSIKVPRMPEEE